MAAPIDLSTAASLEQQVYLGILEMHKLEQAIAADSRPDNTQVTFDLEAETVDLAVNLATTFTVVNGDAQIAAKPYLA